MIHHQIEDQRALQYEIKGQTELSWGHLEEQFKLVSYVVQSRPNKRFSMEEFNCFTAIAFLLADIIMFLTFICEVLSEPCGDYN